MNKTECGICNELNHLTQDIENLEYRNLIDCNRNVLLETDYFFVIPSYGPLNKSHAMIVPKRHKTCFADLTINEIEESNSILILLSKYYSNYHNETLTYFESGAGSISNHSGGCITHAHIHCVSHSQKFEEMLFEEIDLIRTFDNHYDGFDSQNGYIWYKNSQDQSFYYNNPLLPSQFLRYLYCQSLDSCWRWNWRDDIDVQGINAVIDAYKNLKT